MKEGAVPKRQRTIDEMFGVAGPATKKEQVIEKDKVMEVVDETELALSHDLGLQEVEVVGEGQEAMYPVYSFRNAAFKELVDEQELKIGESLSDSVVCCSATCHVMFEAVMKSSLFVTVY